MLARLRSRLTYANVMSTIAVFVAVGTGGAYAANTVFSIDIVDGEVKTADLAAENVTGGKVMNGSLTAFDLALESLSSGRIFGLDGSDIDDDSLTGANILESSLEKVQSAANADQLGGSLPASFMRSPTKWKKLDTIGERLPIEIGNPPCSGSRDCTASIRCDPGDVLLSGGYDNIDNGTRLIAGFPFNANGFDHKYVMHWANNSTADTVRLVILCADQ